MTLFLNYSQYIFIIEILTNKSTEILPSNSYLEQIQTYNKKLKTFSNIYNFIFKISTLCLYMFSNIGSYILFSGGIT